MGSPPLSDWTVPGINVTANDVTISALKINNFTTGMKIHEESISAF